MTADCRHDLTLAAALALLLSAVWCVRGWADLAHLRLPDTDDVMRLQQVRDWLAGQAFADVAQHRLADGIPLHWSRLADLAPAVLIASLAPLVGRHAAEIAAVIAWPALLFAAALFLVARLTRALGESALAPTAVVVAAIAFPSTTIFLPGRIDHHGLQLVLLLGALLGALGPATLARGVAIGLCVAASLVIGLETAPLLAAIGGCVATEWIATGAPRRLLGLGVGALGGLMIARVAFATDGFFYSACDGFTANAWRAATVAAVAATLLPVMPGLSRRPRRIAAHAPLLSPDGGPRNDTGVTDVVRRGVVAAIIMSIAAAIIVTRVPACLHPYGAVDPLLTRLWLDHVAEAQPAWTAPLVTAIGYLGVMAAGLVAAAWQAVRHRSRGWATLLAVQLAATAVALVQLRGAQSGAMLAAPALAAVIAAARRHGSLAMVAAWLGSAGLLYPLAANALTPAPLRETSTSAKEDCASSALLTRLRSLPADTVMAPIDAGPTILIATPQRIVAAPYHRNNAGNLAMFRFFMQPPDRSSSIARQWRVRYVLACRSGVAALHGGLLDRLNHGQAPTWLRPIDSNLYRVTQ